MQAHIESKNKKQGWAAYAWHTSSVMALQASNTSLYFETIASILLFGTIQTSPMLFMHSWLRILPEPEQDAPSGLLFSALTHTSSDAVLRLHTVTPIQLHVL